jgi:hypothetical protein
MRGTVMTYAVLAALMMSSAAVAHNNPKQPSQLASARAQTTGQADNSHGQANRVWEAPIGHRQPSARDVPPGLQDNYGVRSLEDETIDRKLRICRDC